MKFSVAWANVLSENQILKWLVVTLTLVTGVFSLVLGRLAIREPIVIERECSSRYRTTTDPKHTNMEIEAFVMVAVPMRFDSNAADSRALLSENEYSFRTKEQEDLKKKGILQRVLVNSLKMDGKNLLVDTDRLLSAGKVRSVLPFSLRLELASVGRTPSNPYGLILQRVSQVQEEVK